MNASGSGGSVEAAVETRSYCTRWGTFIPDELGPGWEEHRKCSPEKHVVVVDRQALTNLTDRIGELEMVRAAHNANVKMHGEAETYYRKLTEADGRIAELEAQVDNHRFLSDKYDEHIAELEGKRDSERGLHALTQHAGLIAQEAWEQAQARIHYLEGRVGELSRALQTVDRELTKCIRENATTIEVSIAAGIARSALSPPMKDEPPKPEPRPNGWGKFSQEEHPATPPMKGMEDE